MELRKRNMLSIIKFSLVGVLAAGITFNAHALSFTTSVGVQPSDVGIITLTQVNANTVKVLLDLKNTTYGIMNTGGPHTPFAFNLAGTETDVTASFIQPLGGVFSFGLLSLSLAGGDATPFGTYCVAINSSAGNGSGEAYYGDLEFNLTRTSGLLTTDFIANAKGYYFGADLTDGNNTGSQAWTTPSRDERSVPDGGTTAALLGIACMGIGLLRRSLV